MTHSILLKNGLVLLHSGDIHLPAVQPRLKTDILIRGSIIAEIGDDIAPEDGTLVIDCSGKIVCPGFISTHSHLWQSQLKGWYVDDTLFDYMPRGNFISHAYTPVDIYWGQLAGSLEAINAGTTTVLDHAHGCQTNRHIQAAIQATVDSGLRCVWAYAEPFRAKSWTLHECVPLRQFFDETTTSYLEELVRKHNTNSVNNRVSIGLAHDVWFLPPTMVQPVFNKLIAAGVDTLTSHVGRDAVQGLGTPISLLKKNASYLFEPESSSNTTAIRNFVLSHATNIPNEEFKLLFSRDVTPAKSAINVSISTTPETESHMCMHRSVAFTPALTSSVPTEKTSLGIDCHASASSFMPHAARLGLANARIRANEHFFEGDGRYPKRLIGDSGQEAFNKFTVNGAKALGLDHDDGGIGRIRVGRRADLVILEGVNSINIGTAMNHDPVVAVTRFSELSDVDTVIIDGVIRKERGMLSAVAANPVTEAGISVEQSLDWNHVRDKLSKTCDNIRTRVNELSIDKARDMMVESWHIDTSKFIDAEPAH